MLTKSLSGIDSGCCQKNIRRRMRAQEGSIGSNTDETELDQLLQIIVSVKRHRRITKKIRRKNRRKV